jgi:hypothetical protein
MPPVSTTPEGRGVHGRDVFTRDARVCAAIEAQDWRFEFCHEVDRVCRVQVVFW